MAGSSSGFVVGLTVAALATVGFLAYQASAGVHADLGKPGASSSPEAGTAGAPHAQQGPAALPVASGAGERVVYSLGADRVWLVGAGDTVKRTFRVTPGSVDPAPGVYSVTSRSSAVTGTDGTPIEHVVRFTDVDGIAIGFSAPVDGSAPQPNPAVKTGGIRESRADGNAMWEFATIGRTVAVIP
ncbi:hypothetical protein J7F01_00840 [Streptomyces sp. ISL-22]|uniref:hypothetical protein n=1 Tax=unclassified Streptomyces TaxID=2593676 RepID=UPI001BEAAF5F|nr:MULTISPECIES: hypothetical protein [unclassified Streptomyces]MBT2421348.1 hypothetical protein [Streptomyces sp. ISL-24]MBT2430771.1 hypothetical protein [Streptomyces sp. ISL-22]